MVDTKIFCENCKFVRSISDSDKDVDFIYCYKCGRRMEKIESINGVKVQGFLTWLDEE